MSLLLGVVVYVGFANVGSSTDLVVVRGAQGVAVTGAGLMSLALVGQLSPTDRRAQYIGAANAWRFAAGIVGTLTAGLLFEAYGFTAVFGVLVTLTALAAVSVGLFVDADPTVVSGVPFTDLAVNRRILTITGFRAQYAFAVTLVRTWIPIFAGVEAASGGLAYSAVAVSVVITAEKFTNMLAQPHTGRLSDGIGRSKFVVAGGLGYGVVALIVPFTPAIGGAMGVTPAVPALGPLSAAFVPLVLLNGLLGVADSLREPAIVALFADEGTEDGGVASSFGIREPVWRPGSVLAPLVGGVLMVRVGMDWVFLLGSAFSFAGVATFVGLLVRTHGSGALSQW